MGKTIGEGSMGKVKLGLNLKTNKWVAIKIIKRLDADFDELAIPDYNQLAIELDKNERNRHDFFPESTSSLLEEPYKTNSQLSTKQANFITLIKKTLSSQTRYYQSYKSELKSNDSRTMREILLSQLVSHPHICELQQIIAHSSRYYIISELVNGKQLLQIISEKKRLPENTARRYARQITSAIAYLHKHSIVHRDLKIENIMVNQNNDIKIIDFGLSNLYSFRKKLNTFCGSLYFAAPELLQALDYFGPETDCWSLGIILYVLVCGKVPFDDITIPNLHKKIKAGKFDLPNYLSLSCKELISFLIVVDPVKRATINTVINSEWINEGYSSSPNCYIPDNSINFPLVNVSQIDKNIVSVIAKYYYILYFGTTNADTFNSMLNEFFLIINSPWYKDYLTHKYKHFLINSGSFYSKNQPNENSNKSYHCRSPSIESYNTSKPKYHSKTTENDASRTISSYNQFQDSCSINKSSHSIQNISEINLINIDSSYSKKINISNFLPIKYQLDSGDSFINTKHSYSIEDNYRFLEGADPLLSIYYMIQAKLFYHKTINAPNSPVSSSKNSNSEKPLPNKPFGILSKSTRVPNSLKITDSNGYTAPKRVSNSLKISDSSSFTTPNSIKETKKDLKNKSRSYSLTSKLSAEQKKSKNNSMLKNKSLVVNNNSSSNNNRSHQLSPLKFQHSFNNRKSSQQSAHISINNSLTSAEKLVFQNNGPHTVMCKLSDNDSIGSIGEGFHINNLEPKLETFYETLTFLDNNPNYFRTLQIDSTEHKNLSKLASNESLTSKKTPKSQEKSFAETDRSKFFFKNKKSSSRPRKSKLFKKNSSKNILEPTAPALTEPKRTKSYSDLKELSSSLFGNHDAQKKDYTSDRNFGIFKSKKDDFKEKSGSKVPELEPTSKLKSFLKSSKNKTNNHNINSPKSAPNVANHAKAGLSSNLNANSIYNMSSDADTSSLVSLLSILNSYQVEIHHDEPDIKKKKWIDKFLIKLVN
ncbi:hypothetical protein BB561_003128 [Smittium simulii]|uniref:Protein kinase domain-containing protein n=1 Tax=Smittium simulii TaxID=133385 RepID=A0A2T9YN08_9FUNG|nr:hypothetical protein BB561_003128 [Smittium simulii]